MEMRIHHDVACKTAMGSSSFLCRLLARKEGAAMARFPGLAKNCLPLRFSLTIVLIAGTVLQSAGAGVCASAPTRVVIGYPSPSPRVSPLWMAQDLDFFGKYGLTAQIVLVRNNQMLTAGLVSGV